MYEGNTRVDTGNTPFHLQQFLVGMVSHQSWPACIRLRRHRLPPARINPPRCHLHTRCVQCVQCVQWMHETNYGNIANHTIRARKPSSTLAYKRWKSSASRYKKRFSTLKVTFIAQFHSSWLIVCSYRKDAETLTWLAASLA